MTTPATSCGGRKTSFILAILFLLTSLVFTLLDTSSLKWASLQVFKSVFNASLGQQITAAEESVWMKWEDDSEADMEAKHSTNLLNIPTYTRDDISSLPAIDFSLPFIIRNMSQSNTSVLSLERLKSPPLGNLSIEYFSDARKRLLVPDRQDTLAVIMEKILSGGPEKIGTQMIIHAFPSILQQYLKENEEWLKVIFGGERVRLWQEVGPTVTVPVFVSKGRGKVVTGPQTDEENEEDGTGSDSGGTTRTDLHCEPISNVVLQTAGKKKWTLILPQYSRLLKPTVSPDGRAYFFSQLGTHSSALNHVPRYEVTTREGDLLYVPVWMWHKVEYIPGVTAASMSLFQFIFGEFVCNSPLFALTIVPNLVKEAIGIKIQ